jgi:nicotinate-nucleotide--dimethylbenzimidazole phosphoribosyltransferase
MMKTHPGRDIHIDASVAAQATLDTLAMPRGSLGHFEHVAVELARARGSSNPDGRQRRLLIFAGDHGVVAEAVGVWPQSVTRSIMRLIVDGRAVCSSIAKAVGAPVKLVDVGSIGPALAGACYSDCRVAEGTRNLAVEPAMTSAQFDRAFEVGVKQREMLHQTVSRFWLWEKSASAIPRWHLS